MKDVPPGTPASNNEKTEVPAEELLPSEDEIRKMMLEEAMKLLGRYVSPHPTKARWVTDNDVQRVLDEAVVMSKLIGVQRGVYRGVYALAHTQVEDKDPLRFFFTAQGMVVINPVIVKHTDTSVYNPEGCMSYPEEPIKELVTRFNKIDVVYQTLLKEDGEENVKISPMFSASLKLFESRMWQHEIQHLNGFYIYGEHDPLQAIGFGDGVIPEKEALDKLYTKAE